jgi:hypothetical protein
MDKGKHALLKQNFKLPPAVLALFLQIVAVLCVIVMIRLTGLKFPLIILAFGCGLIASGLSYVAKQANWWLIIQMAFAPALAATLALKIHAGFFLAGFFILLLIFWNTFNTQVPLYLSSKKVWQALESLLPAQKFSFIDIGSGLGGVLTYLACVRPDGSYYGVESAPLPFFLSWLRIRLGGYRQCQVQWGDLWECDLSRYDVVFAYLSPAPMARLWQKAKTEMKPGTIFISSSFNVPGQYPVNTLPIDDMHRSTLLIWKM